jgi:general secretion pathway protein H
MLRQTRGFTLIEILVVLAIMGFVASFVIINGLSSDPTQKLKTEAERFAVIFAMASDSAVLNQQQLGLWVDEKKNTYEFLVLDEDDNWVPIEDTEYLALYKLDPTYRMELKLDGLEWASDDTFSSSSLFDESLSVASADVEIGGLDIGGLTIGSEAEEEEKKKIQPQVFLLSSGDIGDFSLSFIYESTYADIDSTQYQILGKGYLPLERTEALDL